MNEHWKFEKDNKVETMLMLLPLALDWVTGIIIKMRWRKLRFAVNEHWKFEKSN
jgi:hypothetical protein